MRIICISDTHVRTVDVPDGDLLIHAGDFTMYGGLMEVVSFNRWMRELPHEHKVVIAGNHEWVFQEHPGQARDALTAVTYLEHEPLEVAGLRIWGSPWTPTFGDWAFMLNRGAPLREKWAGIPEGLDVLITHGPPKGVLDKARGGEHVGCEELWEVVTRRRPRIHVFGHIHEQHGIVRGADTLFVNASTCDHHYRPVHPPIIIDLDGDRAEVS